LNGAADRIRTWAESTAELRQKFRLAQRFTTFACSRRLASKLMKALDSSACSGESSSSLCARGLRSEHRALKQQHHPPLLVFVRLIGKRVEREYGTVRAEHVLHQRGRGEVVSAPKSTFFSSRERIRFSMSAVVCTMPSVTRSRIGGAY
jgi:hypothetical protein